MNYHNRIMNLPLGATYDEEDPLVECEAYKRGHRDARHQAAKLISELEAEADRLAGALIGAGLHPNIVAAIRKGS